MKQYRRAKLEPQDGDDSGHVRTVDGGATPGRLPVSIGVDIGDRFTEICVLDRDGEVAQRTQVPTTKKGIRRFFEQAERCRVAMEVGTHSAWIQRELDELGFETYVANARKLRAIWDNDSKTDRTDAYLLGEIVQIKPKLLRSIKHRGEEGRLDLKLARARAAMVRARTLLVNHVRGAVKVVGARMPPCHADAFHKQVEALPDELRPMLEPVMAQVGDHTALIRGFDAAIKERAAAVPAVALLTQVPGVGDLTALAFVSIVEDPSRFPKTRRIGSYLGLRPRLDDSGDLKPQLRITKAGDKFLRCLLVQCAQHILGPLGPDSDLKRWGSKLSERGGKNAKKRAVVAVARKLAVLLLTLWKKGEDYDPLKKAKQTGEVQPVTAPTMGLVTTKEVLDAIQEDKLVAKKRRSRANATSAKRPATKVKRVREKATRSVTPKPTRGSRSCRVVPALRGVESRPTAPATGP